MWSSRELAAGLLSLVVLYACNDLTSTVQTPSPPSGIRGTVILGPTCPTAQEPGAHEPVTCLTPYSAQLVVLDGESEVVTRITSGADGRFEVSLPPGEYVVAPQGGDPYPIAQPISVAVVAGEYEDIEINFDTGIR
ncbi:MAG TPA: hypothetical protein VK992_06175 [Candidatus Caenarcaniphilales bacterium]|nr:hypothetical protein [Candidatus Caenarcaniphilales bacterium]